MVDRPEPAGWQPVILALDSGGTCFKSILISPDGKIRTGSSLQVPSHAAGTKEDILGSYRSVVRHARRFAQDHDLKIMGMGVSTPGPFDYTQGTSLMTHKLRAIHGIRLREHLCGDGLLPLNTPIVFLQDTHAFLLGEHWTGAVCGIADAAAITLGTGLGFGVMKGNRILDNGAGGPHCVVFNRAYKDGILEDRISRRGIIAAYGRLTGKIRPDYDVVDIACRARESEAAAIKVFAETGRIMAQELAGVLSGYGVRDIVFGGQISKSFDLFGPVFSQTLAGLGCQVRAVPGRNLAFSALLGAARAVPV